MNKIKIKLNLNNNKKLSLKKVAVVILTYNGKQYLPDLLGSLFRYGPLKVKQEIIIVDNHSSDNTVFWIKEHYQTVTLLEQKENLGFAKGYNVAFKYAISKGFDYVMMLNQDTIVTNCYLDKLLTKIESENNLAAVQPKLMLHPQTNLVNSLGNVIHYLGFGYTHGHRQSQPEFRNQNFEINYCSGAACLINVEVFSAIGFFDEDFFMYHEDLELGWRIKLAGCVSKIVPESIVYHKYEFSRSIKKYYFMERNRFLVLFQNYKIGTLLLILPALIIMEVGLFIFSFINGWWREKLKVYAYFLKPSIWPKILKKHRETQKLRILGDREVVANFSGKIEHQELNNPLVYLINPLFNLYWQVVKRLIFW